MGLVNRAGADLSQPLRLTPRELGPGHSLRLAHLSPGRDVERSGDRAARANSIPTRLFAGVSLARADLAVSSFRDLLNVNSSVSFLRKYQFSFQFLTSASAASKLQLQPKLNLARTARRRDRSE